MPSGPRLTFGPAYASAGYGAYSVESSFTRQLSGVGVGVGLGPPSLSTNAVFESGLTLTRMERVNEDVGSPGGNVSTGVRNFKGEPVIIPEGHIMSPRDPVMSAPPIIESGPFTTAQREAMMQGSSGGTLLSPHHRHQIPTTHGGVIDELPGPGDPSGNIHTAGSPSRHPSPSVFKSLENGNALRYSEIRTHWQAKAQRMIEVAPDIWIDPGL